MRHHEHPRTWLDLCAVLGPDDASALRAFAAERGVDVERAEPYDLEVALDAWRLAGSPESDVKS
jgi:hypothetical protein